MNSKSKIVDRQSELRHWYDYTWARNQFVLAIQRVAPDIVKDLRDRLIPRFRKLVPNSKKGRKDLCNDYKEQDVVLADLRPVINEWAREYRLAETAQSQVDFASGGTLISWMEPIILMSFLDWTLEEVQEQPNWKLPDDFAVCAYMEVPKPFVIMDEGWSPFRESETNYRARLTRQFEQDREKYIQECLHGDKDRPASQSGSSLRLPTLIIQDHFDWLVMYQVKCLSYNEISHRDVPGSARSSITRQAVMSGIKTAAGYVIGPSSNEWLRPCSTGGRPKSKT